MLFATVLGSAMAAIDATVVGIALPAIGHDFNAGLSDLQWVVTAYTLTLAGLLLFAGALGDRYGRKRTFVIGVIWFAAASALCGVAVNTGMLIAARALQGVGAALLTPGSLAIIEASFVPEDRGKAIGAWSGFGGVGTAIGPFLGGWLIQAVSWRLIFAINLPIAVLVIAVAMRHVPESRDTGRHRPGRHHRWRAGHARAHRPHLRPDRRPGQGLGQSAAADRIDRRRGAARGVRLVGAPGQGAGDAAQLFRSVQFSSANVVTFAVYGALGGALFLLPIQLEQVGGYTALQAGISLLPVTLIMLLLSTSSGALAARIGPRLQMTFGPLVIAASFVLFARIGPGANYLTEVLPAVVVFGFGLAINVAPLTSTVLGAVNSKHAGTASAINNDVARAASLIAVAVLPAAAGLTGASYLHPASSRPGSGWLRSSRPGSA